MHTHKHTHRYAVVPRWRWRLPLCAIRKHFLLFRFMIRIVNLQRCWTNVFLQFCRKETICLPISFWLREPSFSFIRSAVPFKQVNAAELENSLFFERIYLCGLSGDDRTRWNSTKRMNICQVLSFKIHLRTKLGYIWPSYSATLESHSSGLT